MSVILPVGPRGILKPGGPQTLDPRNFAVPDGLVGYWGFDADCLDVTNNQAFDLSGNQNTLTFSGAAKPALVDGKIDGASLFPDAGGTVVARSPTIGLPIGNAAFSKSAHIFSTYKGSASNHPNIISWGADTTNQKNGLALMTDGGANAQLIQWFYANDYTWNISDLTGAWHHVVVTYAPPILVLYIDTISQGTKTVTGTPNVQASSLQVGNYTSAATHSFHGKIDDVRIYNRALAPWEVIQLYQAGLAGRRDAGDQMPAWNDLPMLRSSIVPVAMHHYMTQRAA